MQESKSPLFYQSRANSNTNTLTHIHSNVQFLNSSVSSIVRRTKYLFANVRFFRYFLTFFRFLDIFAISRFFLFIFTSTSICRNAVQSQHRYQIKEINLIGRSQFKFIIYFASPTGPSETIGTTHTCIYKINNRLSRRTNLK